MSEKKTTPYADFGKRLTKLREEKGMTKQELAGLCGIAPSTEARSLRSAWRSFSE